MQAVFQNDLNDRIRGNLSLSTFYTFLGPTGGMLIIQNSNLELIGSIFLAILGILPLPNLACQKCYSPQQ